MYVYIYILLHLYVYSPISIYLYIYIYLYPPSYLVSIPICVGVRTWRRSSGWTGSRSGSWRWYRRASTYPGSGNCIYIYLSIYLSICLFIYIYLSISVCSQESSMNILPELSDGLNLLLDSLVKSSFVIEKQPPQVHDGVINRSVDHYVS